MINLRRTTSNKLFISRDSATADEECKPWGVSVFDNAVKISSLTDSGSVYEDHFSDFRVDNVPFESLSECLEYIEPCLGFNTATGGSVADDEILTITYTRTFSTDGENVWADFPTNDFPEAPPGKLIEPIDCLVKYIRGTGEIDIPVWVGGSHPDVDYMGYITVGSGNNAVFSIKELRNGVEWTNADPGTVKICKYFFDTTIYPALLRSSAPPAGILRNTGYFDFILWSPCTGTSTDSTAEVTIRYRLINE